MLDKDAPLPDSLRIFYWPYPSRVQVLVRDAVLLDMSDQDPYAFWLVKFYPIAFMVVLDSNPRLAFPVATLEPLRSSRYEDEVQIPLTWYPLPPIVWPEAPTERTAVAYGQEAIAARGLTHRSS